MPQVEVIINGRGYRIACEEGQEKHLSGLAAYVDGRVAEMVASTGQIGDARLLVMVSLLVADELSEARGLLSEAGLAPRGEGSPHDRDAGLAERIEAIAERIESVAAALERA